MMGRCRNNLIYVSLLLSFVLTYLLTGCVGRVYPDVAEQL